MFSACPPSRLRGFLLITAGADRVGALLLTVDLVVSTGLSRISTRRDEYDSCRKSPRFWLFFGPIHGEKPH
jgi:hypothetical protein